MLTARNVRVRRIAKRVVIDPKLQMPLDAKLVTTTNVAPTIVACNQTLVETDRVKALRDRGVEILGMKKDGDELPLEPLLKQLSDTFEVQHVLVEAGTGLMTRLFHQNLANEAWLFIAPIVFGDAEAPASVCGNVIEHVSNGIPIDASNIRRRHGDMIVRGRVRL